MTARRLPLPGLPEDPDRGRPTGWSGLTGLPGRDGRTGRRQMVPGPSGSRDVAVGPAAELARRELSGFGPARLLSDVSVARAAGFVVESLREPVEWLRVMLTGLDAFRQAQPQRRLGPALAAAWSTPARAEHAIAEFSAGVATGGPPELARLGLGPKLWYTVNGVPIGWRPLTGGGTPPPTPNELRLGTADLCHAAGRALLRAGVVAEELPGLRIGDLGRLVPGEVFVPDAFADPLVVRLGGGRRRVAGEAPWLVALGYEARISVIAAVLTRFGQDAACRHGHEPLLVPAAG